VTASWHTHRMTIYKVVELQVGSDDRWGVQWITPDGETDTIGPFDTEAEAHAEAQRMTDLESLRST